MRYKKLDEGFYVITDASRQKQEDEEKAKTDLIELQNENAVIIYESMIHEMEIEENNAELWYAIAIGGM